LSKSNYLFTDRDVKPGLIYYYRLKQIDFDEQFTFSEVVQARLSTEEIQFEIAPNPAKDQLSVFLTKDGRHNGELMIVDILGKVVKIQAFEMSDQARFDLELTNLPAGVYFLRVNLNQTDSGIRRFIKK